ncbi:flagellar export protein FliJ [Ancylobacter terrae]|uniref:flagellar export protein FliJ n=1 Tax=Ancylobacter sp. sgz301288 TaxID=3342077 RepID=UPI003858E529
MKSRDTLIRLKRFQAEEKRRQLAQIETMIADFERMAQDLEREISAEQQRAGITDPGHFAYPTYARAAAQRRDNLKRSADELKQQLDDAMAAFEAASEELRKVEALGERERGLEAPLEVVRGSSRGRAIYL